MRGRKPIPTNLKILNGNPGKRAISADEPRPDVVIPTCPSQLQGEARREWRRITRELAAVGLVTRLDRAALAAYCAAWGRWVEAEKHLRDEGTITKTENGYQVQNPWLAIANRAIEQMSKIGVEFGLTPSSRTRLHATPTAEAVDEMDAILDAPPQLRLTESA